MHMTAYDLSCLIETEIHPMAVVHNDTGSVYEYELP